MMYVCMYHQLQPPTTNHQLIGLPRDLHVFPHLTSSSGWMDGWMRDVLGAAGGSSPTAVSDTESVSTQQPTQFHSFVCAPVYVCETWEKSLRHEELYSMFPLEGFFALSLTLYDIMFQLHPYILSDGTLEERKQTRV